jgi:hypothetical protein
MARADADQDLKEMLNEEILRVDEAIAAPSKPMLRNFEASTAEEKVRERPGAAAASSGKDVHGFSLS